MSNEPAVVLADEPTGNLDSAATLEVLRLFESLHEAGQTLLIVTHDSRIAATADRLISMRDGAFVDETRLTGGPLGQCDGGAGRRRPGPGAELAERALGRVAETGRRAIAETGRLLHVIRDTDNELGLPPTPGLGDIDALVGEFRRDGLDIDPVEAVPDDLPVAVDMSAYRIVREALTNALRYSPTHQVGVEVLGTPSALTIRAVNPSDVRTGLGSGSASPAWPSGSTCSAAP